MPTRDGRRLFAMALPGPGADAPTVVFEAGAGTTRSSWALVQPAVGQLAQAVVYDRAGLGRSPADPQGRSLRRMAEDLADLLDQVRPGGPYVLVGHSAGGPIVRLAASLRPHLVVGLVLVDPTDEGADVLFGPAFRRAERMFLRVGLVLARLGLLKLLYRRMVAAAPAPDVRSDLEREGFTPAVLRTQRAQARTFLDELSAWRTDPPTLPDIPVTVISGAHTGDGMNRATRDAANASHARRAARSSHGRHVVAPNSGHLVPLTDPQVVVEEIRSLVQGRAAPAP